MSGNRRRHANAIPVASFLTWALIGLFACGGGLAYVWCKNQLYTTGSEIKALERELVDLKNKNEVAQSKIAQLSSTAKLQERYDTNFIKLVPITNDRINVLSNTSAAPVASAAGELRPVSNERTHE
ncbi:MAG TPA: hypothetical protein VK961_28780 [Chthoniobacter sp.]|nr:hypothetical protein [Chthoniobacter sp.]